MTCLDFTTISGPATGSEVTYFDAVVTTVLKLRVSARGGTDSRVSFFTVEHLIPLRFVKHKCG